MDPLFEDCLDPSPIPGLIDIHAHLSWQDFDDDLEQVLERAKARGIAKIILVSMDAEDQEKNKILSIASSFPALCFASFGLHPKHVPDANIDNVLSILQEKSELFVCVGECGLDSSPQILANGETPEIIKENQRTVLAKQIQLAFELKLPLNVHSRGAGHHTITFIAEQLKKFDNSERPGVVMHSFDGKAKYALNAVQEHGFYFSIPPSVVRSPQMCKLVQALPLENLLLESDSPSLGFDKTIRNEPCNITISCRAIAKLKEISVEKVAQQTIENTFKLFPKLNKI